MKTSTRKELSNRMVQYGALSLAISGLTDGNSQTLNYFDIDDVGGQYVVHVFDLNGDGQGDFNIRNVEYLYNYVYYRSYLGIWPAPGNAVLGSSANSLIYPFALDEGEIISAGNSNWKSNNFYQTLIWSYCYSNSNWCGVTDKYLGLRFNDLSANTYYAWARLDVTAADDWVLKDYAFYGTPDTPIMAGEGRLDIDENILRKVKIIALNKSIAIYNLTDITNYRLFNITGQSLLEGVIENDTYVIEANTMSSGVYIIELKDLNTNAISRKKIRL
ncbi:T9SS type A sorting domain-containing protein [Yeosuana sp. MJ-SS3]|uniref:T9SS type A sorting domain-containing protein n=1 Tax=Gilvirhabdus luticola TaxID=3079858 RepID=A0ABU3U9U5_9FLAO|nr:T9SS type A sorting domain-containing protein [Yeosuana sp. MJ-SS3]MDU8887178.1 T9SS type A sorting domain-containing protein [Yeosuana sp. MJ-SS3]